jgi:hypothetical protein
MKVTIISEVIIQYFAFTFADFELHKYVEGWKTETLKHCGVSFSVTVVIVT